MNILLIDDEDAIRQSLSIFLNELGHDVKCAKDGREGLELFNKENFQLVFTDIRMPHMDGFEFLRHIKQEKNSIVDVVLITGHGNTDSAIKALREGAYDYLQKPVNIDELELIIDRVSEHLSLKITNEELTNRFEESVRERVSETESQLENVRAAFRENVGLKISIHSKKLADLFTLAEKFHKSPSVPVLIEGETGTGKELLARFIHYGPDMVAQPFIAINCAAIPHDLFESELFGHEAGAFTGASSTSKKGQLEIAGEGSLLLDEIGEMPISTQVKLLRVLEDREYYRVGGVKRLTFKARIIASTNKSLQEESEKSTFRSDLYHRLNVGYLRIPPLRERKEEIVPLMYDFFTKACVRHGKRTLQGFTPEAERFMENQPLPGNVRQLQNAIERVVLLYDGPFIDVDHLSFLESNTTTELSPSGNKIDLGNGKYCVLPQEGIDLDELITQLVQEAMRMSDGNKTLAAKLLNISPRTISRRLDKQQL
ncbi:MAG: sigma-54-dependent Fis family transcriptional regulator [Candidatus Latescibacteria bacterium]|nr:sigma-54-dependent Fis family transcriptional regulator [Candidatus Latescibacterota bacterium]